MSLSKACEGRRQLRREEGRIPCCVCVSVFLCVRWQTRTKSSASGWDDPWRSRSQLQDPAGDLLHTAAVVAQDLALFTQVLRVLLALVGNIQAVGFL